MQESLSIPHTLAQLLPVVLATFLGWIGGWISRRKREPHEIAKITAETRQITVNTDVSLIQAATTAITGAERLRQERNHWEMKAFDLEVELRSERLETSQLRAQASLDNYQLEKQMNFIKAMGLKEKYIALDKPKEPQN